jgi:hypothetical protein
VSQPFPPAASRSSAAGGRGRPDQAVSVPCRLTGPEGRRGPVPTAGEVNGPGRRRLPSEPWPSNCLAGGGRLAGLTTERRCSRAARQKLNRAFFNGSLLLAGAVGALAGSWLVFGLALTALVGANLYAGEIRLPRASANRSAGAGVENGLSCPRVASASCAASSTAAGCATTARTFRPANRPALPDPARPPCPAQSPLLSGGPTALSVCNSPKACGPCPNLSARLPRRCSCELRLPADGGRDLARHRALYQMPVGGPDQR